MPGSNPYAQRGIYNAYTYDQYPRSEDHSRYPPSSSSSSSYAHQGYNNHNYPQYAQSDQQYGAGPSTNTHINDYGYGYGYNYGYDYSQHNDYNQYDRPQDRIDPYPYRSRRNAPEKNGERPRTRAHQPLDTYRPSVPPPQANNNNQVYIPPHQRNVPAGQTIPHYSDGAYNYNPPTSYSTSRNGNAHLDSGRSSIVATKREYSSQASSSPPRRSKYQSPPPPAVQLPSADYLDLSQSTSLQNSENNTITPKLLVLDLNGALVYRNKASTSKRPYPRPYLGCFLQYLFLPEPTEAAVRPWEVFVWSSAQPHNVRMMVEGAFGKQFIAGIWEEETDKGKRAKDEGEGRLLGVWARDKMGLKSADYSRKVQTTKDLRKVIDHLRYPSDASAPQREYDERTVVLLDDSPLKAVYQPWNQIVIPEFDKQEYQDSRAAATEITAVGEDDGLGRGMDMILLAVIGVLDQLCTVTNVPAWIRAGGLQLGIPSSGGDDLEPSVENLPSHESFAHWYQDPVTLSHWIDRGKDALKRKGIKIEHGVGAGDDVDNVSRTNLASSSPPPRMLVRESLLSKREEKVMNDPDSPRGWSPSRPSSLLSQSPTPFQNDVLVVDDAVAMVRTRGQSRGSGSNNGPFKSTAPVRHLHQQQQQQQKQLGRKNSWKTLKATDVAMYLNNIAENMGQSALAGRLDIEEREHIRSARDIIQKLNLPNLNTHHDVLEEGEGDGMVKSTKNGQRWKFDIKYESEYHLARELNPELSKRQFMRNKMIEEEEKNST